MRASRSLAVIFVVVAAVCARLGLWQLDRLRERRAANAAASAKRTLPPVILGATESADSTLIDRRVVAAGRYDHTHDLVLRGQVYQGVPGVHIVTPLRVEGMETVVLVNRGFVPTPDAT